MSNLVTTVTLSRPEEKKHSVRYNARSGDDTAAISSLYVHKRVLPRPFPKAIEVTIHAVTPKEE